MFAEILNFFVHPSLNEDADRLLRVRILVAVLLTLVIQESTVLILLLTYFPRFALVFGGSLTLVSVFTSAGLLVVLRNTGNYLSCSIAATVITLALIVAGICVSGGFSDSPVTQLIITPLLMAYFFGGMRWGNYMVAITFLISLALIALESRGLGFFQDMNTAAQIKHARLLISFINFSFIAGMALAYEYAAVGLRRERDEEHMKYMRLAKTDPLTGLANRRNFDTILAERMQSYAAANPPHQFILGYIDLDGFKPINDDYGHAVGDEVLRIVSDRLRAALRDSEFVGRYGGDEFMLILDAQSNPTNLEALAQRLLSSIAQPINTSKGLVAVSGSIGFAHFPCDGNDIEALKQAADTAMYAAKRTRSGWLAVVPNRPSAVGEERG